MADLLCLSVNDFVTKYFSLPLFSMWCFFLLRGNIFFNFSVSKHFFANFKHNDCLLSSKSVPLYTSWVRQMSIPVPNRYFQNKNPRLWYKNHVGSYFKPGLILILILKKIKLNQRMGGEFCSVTLYYQVIYFIFL